MACVQNILTYTFENNGCICIYIYIYKDVLVSIMLAENQRRYQIGMSKQKLEAVLGTHCKVYRVYIQPGISWIRAFLLPAWKIFTLTCFITPKFADFHWTQKALPSCPRVWTSSVLTHVIIMVFRVLLFFNASFCKVSWQFSHILVSCVALAAEIWSFEYWAGKNCGWKTRRKKDVQFCLFFFSEFTSSFSALQKSCGNFPRAKIERDFWVSARFFEMKFSRRKACYYATKKFIFVGGSVFFGGFNSDRMHGQIHLVAAPSY